MALENATYIHDLVATNPPASDPLAQAANHLPLIKGVLQNSFPKVTSAVTATSENLSNGTPVGLIAMWSGATIPSGWTLCNGVTVARMDGSGNITPPDLRDRFIVGSGDAYGTGATGGNWEVTLTQAQMPAHVHSASTDSQGSHVHPIQDNGHSHGITVAAGYAIPQNGQSGGNWFINPVNAATGPSMSNVSVTAAGLHAHNVYIGSAGGNSPIDIRPPYYALAFIMKV